MKYYLIAGEASGDLHGSNLIRELRQLDTRATIRCWGGDLMQAAGGELVKHYRDLAFMGFAEVVKNLPTILRNIRFCKDDISQWQPDAVILIDYPGFNLRIAEWAKQQGLRVIFYISPQVWAWKENRVKKMKQYIDRMLCILPFEKKYYRERWNWEVEYVGHPLVEVIEKARQQPAPPEIDALPAKPLIALLPGSRKQEIAVKLPIMLSVADAFPDHQFVVAQAPGLDESFYGTFFQNRHNVSAVHNQTYALLNRASAALVTSGTATLETALFGVPQVVCYKGSNISYQIARRLIRIKYISLVNLIMDRPVVTELIQHELTKENLVKELRAIVSDRDRIQTLQQEYARLKNLLSEGGRASANAAESIYAFISERKG
ncbi:lipid-A-disaccharide synthase [Sediminibacterium soli]|uniref:lipid-A-disaccharide synthase n=1 Tax=Sediminibacterium soli TaxID=2698829 RepID=UPI00137A3172|nr:lipid-A-disaccharide synthase [Sediminibacterium soli]NCI48109.1 lipid-A-disaccharide synthase [Sediminibacterium soli]